VAQELSYKGYRLLVSPVGKGWRAMIFPPGSSSALPESPATLEKSPKEAIVVEAKKIVDARVPTGNSRSDILVMQSTQNGHGERLTDCLHGARDRRILP
jgi:hypothetical protein